MKKILLIVFLFVVILPGANLLFAQQQVINSSSLPNDVVKQKIALIDSVRKANNFKQQKEQQDNIYYKSLTEQGYTQQYIDSLHKAKDPSFVPASYSEFDRGRIQHSYKNGTSQSNQKNDHLGTNPIIMATAPESDCMNGIVVCAASYTQSVSYSNYGTVQEVFGTCLSKQEQKTVWYIFTISTAGSLGFTVTTLKDYDYALYDLTAIGGCSNVPSSTPVRCNYSGTTGNTGMTSSPASSYTTNISVGSGGSPFENGITSAPAGETYALVLDNFTGDATGYTLAFSGSAGITDGTAPTFTSASYNCSNKLTLTFSEQITSGIVISSPSNIAQSLATDGSDFAITPAGNFNITKAAAVTSGNLTTQATLTITPIGTPSPGTYTITVKSGSDGNTLFDKCGNAMATTQKATFQYLGAVTASSPATICAGKSSTVSVTPTSGVSYSWSPSGITTYSASVTPAVTTVYQCSVSIGSCSSLASTTVTVSSIPAIDVTPTNTVICSGTTAVLTASPSGGTAPYSYLWTGGQTTAVATGFVAGGYTVTVTTAATCTAIGTASVSVGTSSSNCNIVYVSSGGGGDGTTSDAPTDIATALGSATCGAYIKMSVGTYTVTDVLNVNSYTTIEGGYNSDFTTKTSDLRGGTNSTTIRRSNNPDGGAGTSVTLFSVAASASNFRFQDLRIEMPGATAATSTGSANPYTNGAGSQQTNYAIKLGAGCTSYGIVRCFIDAGKGAN